jgi:hypothetical protein
MGKRGGTASSVLIRRDYCRVILATPCVLVASVVAVVLGAPVEVLAAALVGALSGAVVGVTLEVALAGLSEEILADSFLPEREHCGDILATLGGAIVGAHVALLVGTHDALFGWFGAALLGTVVLVSVSALAPLPVTRLGPPFCGAILGGTVGVLAALIAGIWVIAGAILGGTAGVIFRGLVCFAALYGGVVALPAILHGREEGAVALILGTFFAVLLTPIVAYMIKEPNVIMAGDEVRWTINWGKFWAIVGAAAGAIVEAVR